MKYVLSRYTCLASLMKDFDILGTENNTYDRKLKSSFQNSAFTNFLEITISIEDSTSAFVDSTFIFKELL